MFRIQFQSRDRKGNFTTVKSFTLDKYDSKLAEAAELKAAEKGLSVRFYIAHEDAVPAGYASRKLEFSTVIWKQLTYTPESAMSEMEAL